MYICTQLRDICWCGKLTGEVKKNKKCIQQHIRNHVQNDRPIIGSSWPILHVLRIVNKLFIRSVSLIFMPLTIN